MIIGPTFAAASFGSARHGPFLEPKTMPPALDIIINCDDPHSNGRHPRIAPLSTNKYINT